MVTPQHSPKRSQKANISAKFGSDAHTSCAAALATSGENVVSGLTIATGGLPTAMRYIIPNSGKNLNFRESKSKQIKNKQITKVSRICSHHFDIPLFEPENVQCYRGGHCSVGSIHWAVLYAVLLFDNNSDGLAIKFGSDFNGVSPGPVRIDCKTPIRVRGGAGRSDGVQTIDETSGQQCPRPGGQCPFC